MTVILNRAVEVGAGVARSGSEFAVLESRIAVGGQQLNIQGLGGLYEDIFLPLHGEHQAKNAGVALAAVEAFFGASSGKPLDIATVRTGFAKAISPGRLERVPAPRPSSMHATTRTAPRRWVRHWIATSTSHVSSACSASSRTRTPKASSPRWSLT